MDIGLEMAGFATLSAVDSDQDCAETLRLNQLVRLEIQSAPGSTYLRGTRVLQADIRDLSLKDLVDHGSDVDIVAGGPPCQPFSSAGLQRSLDDPRGDLFVHFARLVGEIQPKLVLFENVRGLVTARGPSGRPGEALALVLEAFESQGYATRCMLMNAADYGAPQRRVRLFIIGSRLPILPAFPSPTHSEAATTSLFASLRRWVSLGEFLDGRQAVPPHEAVRPSKSLVDLLHRLPSGSGLRSPGVREPTRPGGHWGYKQGTFVADLTKPARTVTAATTQDWIREEDGGLRRLSLRECAALQGFPAEWLLAGTKASQFRQIGNAVPSVFGAVLGRSLMDALEEAERAPSRRRRAVSAPLPADILGAIEYTIRDDDRNGISRPRSHRHRATATPSAPAQ